MPRPSLKEQRAREILDSYLACVAKHGLGDATQERIAAAAGVKRSILRHYLGNKRDMVLALTKHLVKKFDDQTRGFENSGYNERIIDDLIELLFSAESLTAPELVLVYQALIFAVEEYPEIRQPLLSSIERLARFISGVLESRYPNSTKERLDAASHGLVVLHLNYDTISPLNPPIQWRKHSYVAAVSLLESLGEEKKDTAPSIPN